MLRHDVESVCSEAQAKNCASMPLKAATTWFHTAGFGAPLLFLLLFIAASFLMIWRLEAMNKGGVEGTVLGTLVMPYCSGIGNLIFAFVLGDKNGPGEEVLTNSLVNNVTNMTLLIGLPTLFWGMNLLPQATARKGKAAKKKADNRERQINRLSLLLTITAVLFFTGATWALARDGELDASDGLVLIGLFLFWQCFHVFDVLKSNVRQNKSFSWTLPVDLLLLAVGAYGIYLSIDWLVDWLSQIHTGFISAKYLGWLSGWLMVLPNGILAFYYAWRGSPEVVYTSQVGDGHISIPLCLGIFALFRTIHVPAFFHSGVLLLLGAAAIHFAFVAIFGRLPRFMGAVLTAGYAVFIYKGLGG
jgi:cation:H+ antiporter